ncbi:rhombosortase [Gammaproteobacteria bacterium 45_16_T64]|nr:rhombosortase [Gammaproteobacteria bacterium 45_16_T64]
MNNTENTPAGAASDFSPQLFFSQWWFSLLMMGSIIVLSAFGNDVTQALALNADKINGGEWWRLISAHFVHLSPNHALLNVTGYLILGFGFRNEVNPKEEMSALFFAMTGVGLGIYFFSPELSWYVGLSGATYGLLVSNVIISMKKTPFLSGFFLFFVVTKIIYEQFFAPTDRFTEELIGGSVAIDSHLYGAISGIFPGLFWFLRKTRNMNQPKPS